MFELWNKEISDGLLAAVYFALLTAVAAGWWKRDWLKHWAPIWLEQLNEPISMPTWLFLMFFLAGSAGGFFTGQSSPAFQDASLYGTLSGAILIVLAIIWWWLSDREVIPEKAKIVLIQISSIELSGRNATASLVAAACNLGAVETQHFIDTLLAGGYLRDGFDWNGRHETYFSLTAKARELLVKSGIN